MCSIKDVEDITSQFQQSLVLTEDVYAKAREETFVKFYNSLQSKLSKDQLLELIAVVVSDDEIEYRKLYRNGILDILYETNKSITQSLRAQAGINLEKLIADRLTKENISFAKQVYVKNGTVCKKHKNDKGGHRLDFVVPLPEFGDDIKNYIHISSKTTLRERVHQDQHINCSLNSQKSQSLFIFSPFCKVI